MSIRARYEKGVFKPLGDVRLLEGTVVEMRIAMQKRKRRSVKDFSFTGMWKRRKDISDGLSYVNRLRNNPRA